MYSYVQSGLRDGIRWGHDVVLEDMGSAGPCDETNFITMLLRLDIKATQAEQFAVDLSAVSMVTVILLLFCDICIIITNYLIFNSGCLA